MKRSLITVLIIALLISSTSYAFADDLVLTTGGTTGVYYILGGEIAQLLIQYIDDLNITTQSSGGSKANILALVEGEAEIGITQNDVMSYAYAGTEDFGGKPVEGFSAIGALFPEVVQLVVAKDSNIKSIEDIRGHNVGIGAIGSGAYFNVVQALAIVGMTLDDINPQYLSFAESAESFQNRQIDAFFVSAAYPHASIVDAAFKRDIDIVGFSDEQIAAMQELYSFYIPNTIPAGTYTGLDHDVQVPAMKAVMVVTDELDEELVYKITKVLFEHKDELTNAKKAYIDINSAIQGIPTCVKDRAAGITDGSFHPGALRYYKEIGLIK